MMGMGGLETYAVFFLTSVGIYAIVCLALNVQWGLSGQFNFGIVAFYALGAYTSAILTGPDSGGSYLGGFGLPLPIGLIGGMITSLTSEVTMAPKAAPMMTPTARSKALPLTAKTRNSSISFIGRTPFRSTTSFDDVFL